MKNRFYFFACTAMLALAGLAVSCEKNPQEEKKNLDYSVVGYVVDDFAGDPIEGVKVSAGTCEALSASDGAFTLKIAEPAGSVKVTFEKDGYATSQKNVVVSSFVEKVSNLGNVVLQFKDGKVSGKVLNSLGNAGVSGLSVTLGSERTTTDESGEYAFEGIAPDDYVLTIQSGDQTVEIQISKEDFIEGVVTIPTQFFGSDEVLPFGTTRSMLQNAPVLYLNDYWAGADGIGFGEDTDWTDGGWDTDSKGACTSAWLTACVERASMQGNSASEEAFYESNKPGSELSRNRTNVIQSGEGLSIRSRFMKCDPDKYASYVYARKSISDADKYLNIQFGALFPTGAYAEESTNKFYVGVVDLGLDEFQLDEFVLDVNTEERPTLHSVDLSKYVGKEVCIILGTKQYLEAENHKSCYLNFCVEHLTFSPAANTTEPNFVPGEEKLWGVTKEEAASMTALPAGSYSGAFNTDMRLLYVDELLYPLDYYPYLGTQNIIGNFGYKFGSASPDFQNGFGLRAIGESSDEFSGCLYAKVPAGTSSVSYNVKNANLSYSVAAVTEDGAVVTLIDKTALASDSTIKADLGSVSGAAVVCLAVFSNGEDAQMKIDSILIK